MAYVLSKLVGVLLAPGSLLLIGLTLGAGLLWIGGWRAGRLRMLGLALHEWAGTLANRLDGTIADKR